ncbi:MAG: GNAT family N-acetyltransferase [Myxococcaceae bacterium]|jgi:GNAT superfamily N-acetyltransferase|nr:GNAT family N-acetyltransferase [Myxococcaceae bacterium]MCA3012436.1 GNAT family N-acetyltransferase [Myxococcaceae bacterium]
MPLVVRRGRETDRPALESLELETVKRFPTRVRWLETFRELVSTSLEAEPEGFLVADYDGRAIGMAVARVGASHPLTGQRVGRLELLSVAPTWRAQGVGDRLLREAEAYLKAQGCQVVTFSLPADAGADGEALKAAGFRVAGWELEKSV